LTTLRNFQKEFRLKIATYATADPKISGQKKANGKGVACLIGNQSELNHFEFTEVICMHQT